MCVVRTVNLSERTVCFTGHRKIPTEKTEIISQRLKATVIQLIESGHLYFGTGGALGFDTLAAQTVLDLKRHYPQIKLILVLPCLSQSDSWCERDKQVYMDIKERADKVTYVSQIYTKGCMHKRNRYLVDNSSVCVCYLTENKGGTAYTVNYASLKGKLIINVADESLLVYNFHNDFNR